MTINTWQDSKKIYNPVENKVVQADFINTMLAEFPIFEAYYDPANIEVHGKEGTYYGGQMPEDSPIGWSDEFLFNRWPKSEELEQKLPLVEYGLFGDRSSQDLAKLAYEAPDILKKHLQSKVDNVYNQWKRSVQDVILHDLCNKKNYNDGGKALKELGMDYFAIDTDQEKIAENQAKAVSLIADIENKMYAMLGYSKDYNKAGKEAATPSLKSMTLILSYKVNTFLNTYGYSQVFNANYIDLKQKVGRVIIADLPNKKENDLKPSIAAFKTTDSSTNKVERGKYASTDGQIGEWSILVHDNRFYKINDAIKRPKDEGVFVETAFYNSQLKNLIGKWYWAVQGCVEFVNAAAWYCKNTV